MLLTSPIKSTDHTGPLEPKQDPKANLEKSAQDFESYFVGYVFEVANQSSLKADEENSSQEDFFKTMFMQEMAKQGTKAHGGFGLAKQMVSQFERNHPELTKATLDSALSPEGSQATAAPLNLEMTKDEKITSQFGFRKDPITGATEHHDGIDLSMPVGTPVKAVAEGTVTFSGIRGGYGKVVEIEHPDHMTTLYAHNMKTAVKVGQKVQQGDIVSFSGSSGRSTGPHLHFEVRKSGAPVDPKNLVSFEETI
jgi:murein DD-endopeptidase MepM/ murein hydrolase activator NlpD